MPQLSDAERDEARRRLGQKEGPRQIQHALEQMRRKALKLGPRSRKKVGPHVTTVRAFVRGATHKDNVVETRGRSRTFTRRGVLVVCLVGI